MICLFLTILFIINLLSDYKFRVLIYTDCLINSYILLIFITYSDFDYAINKIYSLENIQSRYLI